MQEMPIQKVKLPCNFRKMKMNRKSYIAVFASLLFFAACSKVQTDPAFRVPESSHAYIFFEPEVVEVQETKATLMTGTSLPHTQGSAFGVLGFTGSNKTSIFNGGSANVYWDSGNELFKYDNLAIWYGNDTEHRFYAYYPYGLNDSVAEIIPNDGDPYIAYTQPESESAMVDILTAYTCTTKVTNVPLEFIHRLWALDIVIINNQTAALAADNSSTENPSLYVSDVKVHVNYSDGGTIPLSGGDSSPSENSSDYSYTIYKSDSGEEIKSSSVEGVTVEQYSKQYGSLLFIPGGTLKYRLEIKYIDSRGQENGSRVFYYPSQSSFKTSDTSFEGGKRYKLTIKKTNDAFVIGSYFDPDGDEEDFSPGDWSDKNVPHTFN